MIWPHKSKDRAGIYHYINNGQIWADTVADEFAVSIQDMAKSFGSTQILI